MPVATTGRATIDAMKRLCSDENNLELYVPTFKNNCSQKKLDDLKGRGKVFEVEGETLIIWQEVEEQRLHYIIR
jgi:hypothetical protein